MWSKTFIFDLRRWQQSEPLEATASWCEIGRWRRGNFSNFPCRGGNLEQKRNKRNCELFPYQRVFIMTHSTHRWLLYQETFCSFSCFRFQVIISQLFLLLLDNSVGIESGSRQNVYSVCRRHQVSLFTRGEEKTMPLHITNSFSLPFPFLIPNRGSCVHHLESHSIWLLSYKQSYKFCFLFSW